MNYKSQLGYIMDLIEITGKDLALSIKVDRTLVSKWKNKARPIKTNNVHFNNLVEALIFFNSRRKDSILERFFGKIYPEEDKNEPEYLEVCLRLWLDGKELGNFNNLNDWRTSETALYAANIEIYKGNQGKRDALIDFFDYALALPSGQEIFISDLENQGWLFEDQVFFSQYQKKYKALVDCGHNITIIHHLRKIYTEARNIGLNQFKKYYSGQVTSYYNSNEVKNNLEPSLYIIHRHMSLLSQAPDDEADNRYIVINRDPFSIQHFVRLFVDRIQSSHPMVSTFSSQGSNLKNFIDNVLSTSTHTNVYYTAPQLPLPLLSKSILEKILKTNHVPEQMMPSIEMVRLQNKDLFERSIQTHDAEVILSANVLKSNLQEPEVKLLELSSICKKNIAVSQEIYLEMLSHASELEQTYDNLNISVLPFDTHDILNDVALWMFEDLIMYTIKIDQGQNFVISDAPIILSQVLKYMQNLLMENEGADKLNTYIK